MNGIEAWVYILALAGLIVYLHLILTSGKQAVLIGIFTAIPLFLSIERTSQFYTFDETYIVPEITGFFQQANLGRWIEVKLRTTLIIQGAVAFVLRTAWPAISDQKLEMIMKGLHWLIGFATLLLVHYVLQRYFLPRERQETFAALFFGGMLLLPITNLGLKVLNADVVSLHLGATAGLLMVAAVKEQRRSLAWWGLPVAYLAAQEKLNLSPLIIPALGVLGFVHTSKGDSWQAAMLTSIRYIMRGLAALIGPGLILALIPAAVRGFNFIETAALMVSSFGPLSGWAWPLFYLLGDIAAAAFSIPPAYMFGLTVVTFGGSIATSIGIWTILRSIPRERVSLQFKVWIGVGLLAIVILGLGMTGHYGVVARLAPAVPIDKNLYQPGAIFNGFTVHYGARTLIGHIAAHTAFISGIFITGLPTAFWLVLAAVGWFAVKGQHQLAPGSGLLIAGGFSSVLVFGCLELPPRITYLNVSLFMVALGTLLALQQRLQDTSLSIHYGSIVLFAVLTLIEIIPFAPVYASFRPLWLTYSKERQHTQRAGYLDALWPGWGEEMMLAGILISQDCPPDGCPETHIYLPYGGEWLAAPETIDTTNIVFSSIGEETIPYTESDYYVLNRVSLAYHFINQPHNIDPVHIIDVRGYEQAWVYRGDQLKAAGFTFQWQNPYQ